MSTEIEVQILHINYDDIIKKIKKLGGKIKFDWIKFRIAVFYPCLSLKEQKEKYDLIFTRVRDEGLGKITITTKTKAKSNSKGKFVNEYEIESTNSFENCRDLLLANHLNMKSYQERLRQKWIIPNRPDIKEIVFDIWPGLPIYMEIEATSEKSLNKILDELDTNKDMCRYSGAGMFYNEILGIPVDTINNHTPKLDFSSVGKLLKSDVTKKKEFNKILKEQKKDLIKFGFEKLLLKSEKKQQSKKQSRK
jgi:hypothetical protein